MINCMDSVRSLCARRYIQGGEARHSTRGCNGDYDDDAKHSRKLRKRNQLSREEIRRIAQAKQDDNMTAAEISREFKVP